VIMPDLRYLVIIFHRIALLNRPHSIDRKGSNRIKSAFLQAASHCKQPMLNYGICRITAVNEYKSCGCSTIRDATSIVIQANTVYA